MLSQLSVYHPHSQVQTPLVSEYPSAPLNLCVSDTNKGEVTLTWDDPESDGGAPIMDYLVEMRPAKELHFIVVTKVPVDTHKYTVKGLREGVKYYFRVRAENIKGTSEEAVELDEPVMAKALVGKFA